MAFEGIATHIPPGHHHHPVLLSIHTLPSQRVRRRHPSHPGHRRFQAFQKQHMFAKVRESVEDVSPSTIVIVATAAVVGGVLLASSSEEPFASSNARSSNHLWLPEDHYLFRQRTTSPPLTITTNSPSSSSSSSSSSSPTFFFSSSSDEKESLLRRKLETAVRREEKLRTVLKELSSSGESLSRQIQELLQSRGEGKEGRKEGGGGGAATMLGKTRDAVARDRQQFIHSQQVEARGLRIKLANLEQQSYLTKKALEKSKEQTGIIHTNSFHSLRGERASSPRSPSDTTQWSVVPSFHDAVTQMRYELLRLDNDSMKKIQMNISKIQQSKEETSTIMLQSLYLCKSGFEEYCQLDSFTKISSAWNVSQTQLSNMPRSECSTLFCFCFCFCFSSFYTCTKYM